MSKLALLLLLFRYRLPYRVPGMWRLSLWLARGLEAQPVVIENQFSLYADLRSLPESPLRLLLSSQDYESGEQALFRQLLRPRDVVYDIGANLGLFVALFAALVGPRGRVVAFEPNPRLCVNLRRTVAGIPFAQLHECALAKEPGELTFFVPDDPMMGSLADWSGQATEQVRCQVKVLDEMVKNTASPDLLKIDTEGAEFLVLQGATASLADPERAPIVFFEQIPKAAAAFGYAPESAQRLLRQFEWMSFYHVDEDGSLTSLPEEYAGAGNLLAVPAARRSRLEGVRIHAA